MAKLYVTEFSNVGMQNGVVPIAALPVVVDQTPVAIGGGSLQSAAFNVNTEIVQLSTDAICSVAFGTNPTATANSMRLPADTMIYFAVPPGLSYKVAVISNT